MPGAVSSRICLFLLKTKLNQSYVHLTFPLKSYSLFSVIVYYRKISDGCFISKRALTSFLSGASKLFAALITQRQLPVCTVREINSISCLVFMLRFKMCLYRARLQVASVAARDKLASKISARDTEGPRRMQRLFRWIERPFSKSNRSVSAAIIVFFCSVKDGAD